MSRTGTFVAKSALAIALAMGCIYLAAQLGSLMAVRQITAVMSRQARPAGPRPIVIISEVIEIDFCQALGIGPDELKAYVKEAQVIEGRKVPQVTLTIQNGRGEFLHEGDVVVRWDGGEQIMHVGRSAILNVPLRMEMLSNLRMVVPPGFTKITQMSIPSGDAYTPAKKSSDSALDFPIVSDLEIEIRMRRRLAKMLRERDILSTDQLREQLKRTVTAFPLAEVVESPVEMTMPEIHSLRRESVVVVGHLFPSGKIVRAGGVIIHSSGVIATAYHVIDKPMASARCVLTLDGQTYPIQEVLAADQPNDVALIKVDAKNLSPVAISGGDKVGSAVAVMGHSGSQNYLLTEGVVSRYASVQSYGRNAIQMAITADFADGGSGGPVFNARGELAGIVSATHPLGMQMVIRVAAPAIAIRALLGEPLPETIPID